jgi:cell division protein FtsW
MTSHAVPAGVGEARERLAVWARRLDSPTATYYLLLAVTGALVAIGLVMVLSASSVMSLEDTKSSSAYSIFKSQAVFAGVGAVALLVASRLGVNAWRRLAFPALLGAIGLQMLVFVPHVGVTINGNTNWIRFGGITVQPSEMIKVGLVLVGGLVLARRRHKLARVGDILVPFLVPIVAVSVGLVLVGHDLGTALVMGALIGGMLYTAGVPGRFFAFSFAGAAAVVTVLIFTSSNRLGRFDVWLGRNTDITGAARQPIHGRYALADGGWFGLGLGASREKWRYLSEPHNDFIFAIIGEELGLPGTLVILGLFSLLAFACFRLVTRTTDDFVRIVSAGIMAWIVLQSVINIG